MLHEMQEQIFDYFLVLDFEATCEENKLIDPQKDVDTGVTFPTALQWFQTWVENEVGLDKKFVFVTCGDWDMKTMLPKQCRTAKLQVPQYCKSWLNIKKAYADFAGLTGFIKEMSTLITGLGLIHEGIHHRASDDTMNITNILRALAEKGYKFSVTGKAK